MELVFIKIITFLFPYISVLWVRIYTKTALITAALVAVLKQLLWFCEELKQRTRIVFPQKQRSKYKSVTGVYKRAAVVADSEEASRIGNNILQHKGGNAIDAALAAVLVTDLLSAHSAGIGGGSLFTIYHKDGGWFSVISRETAPQAATEDMFSSAEDRSKSVKGGLAVCVPGEVKGAYEIHKKLGKLPWIDIVKPCIDLCEEGVPLTKAVHKALDHLEDREDSKDFLEYFDDNGNKKPVGALIKLPRLAKTFRRIAEDPMSFYTGSLAKDIVADVEERGGIIAFDDMASYQVKWTKPIEMWLPGGQCIVSTPPPGSGSVLCFILNILSGYKFSPRSLETDEKRVLTEHRIVEAMKYAFGKRTRLGDNVDATEIVREMISLEDGETIRRQIDDSTTRSMSEYSPNFSMDNDYGTAQVSVVDAEGNAVSVTSTINTYFGAQIQGRRTGIIFNNEMNDFSIPNTTNFFQLPASPANFISPGKRPMSSMCPTIVWDETANKVRLVTGAAGGSRITTATAMNIMDILWFERSLPTSIDAPRLHHQLMPEEIQVEGDYPQEVIDGLKRKGHRIGNYQGISVIQAVHVQDDGIIATADFRKGGKPQGF